MEKEQKLKLQYLKVLICCAFMSAASIGLCFYSAGVFYEPLAAAMSISLGQASALTSIMLVAMALTAVGMPVLMKRIPLHYILLLGTILAAGATLGIAFALNKYWLYAFSALQGIGAGCIGLVPAASVMNNWFTQKKSWLLSIVYAAPALAAALFTPVFSKAIQVFGFRMSFVVQAVLILLLMLPALLWKLSYAPGVKSSAPEAEEALPARTKAGVVFFLCLAGIAVLGAFLPALCQYFPNLVTSIGQSAALGASMVSLAMLGNICFKLLGGYLSERFKPVFASGALDLLALASTIGLLISLYFPQSAAMQILAFFFGAVYALAELTLPLLASARFGKSQFTPAYAALNALSTIATACGIYLAGRLYDASHTYSTILWVLIVIEVLILLLVWALFKNEKGSGLVQTDTSRKLIGKIKNVQAHAKQKLAEAAKNQKEKAAAEKKEAAQAQNDPDSQSSQMQISVQDSHEEDEDASFAKTNSTMAQSHDQLAGADDQEDADDHDAVTSSSLKASSEKAEEGEETQEAPEKASEEVEDYQK